MKAFLACLFVYSLGYTISECCAGKYITGWVIGCWSGATASLFYYLVRED